MESIATIELSMMILSDWVWLENKIVGVVCLCRIAVFSVTILKEERVVVVAEQKPGCTDEEVCVVSVGWGEVV